MKSGKRITKAYRGRRQSRKSKRTRLTRRQFEAFFGQWESLIGDRFRKNGNLITSAGSGRKWFYKGSAAYSGKSWMEVLRQVYPGDERW